MKNINEFQFNNKIIKGENLSRRKSEEFKNDLDEKHLEIGKQEIKKSQEEIKFIETINQIIEKELKDLGIDFAKLDIERIKFLKEDDYKSIEPRDDAPAFFNANKNVIIFNHDCKVFKENRLRYLAAILHEILHFYSFQKFNLRTEEDKNIYYSQRLGYSFVNPKNLKHSFNGLNEAIVDIASQEIIKKNQKTLTKELSVTDEERSNFSFSSMYFYNYSFFIRHLINKIANNNEKREEELTNTFIKGHFTGNMMHLREIEKFYGEKSLRVLAKLGTNNENDDLVYDYFDSKNKDKEKILKELNI